METVVSVLPTPNEEGPLLRAFSLSTAAVTTGRNAVLSGLLLLRRNLVTENGFSRRASRQKNQRKNDTKNLHAKSPFSMYMTAVEPSEGEHPAVAVEPAPASPPILTKRNCKS